MREIRNWETLITLQEMTPKELMPRGRKTTHELSAMRRKMKAVSQFIAKSEKKIEVLRARLSRPALSDNKRLKTQKGIEAHNKEIVRRIISLNLNQEKRGQGARVPA